jgi:CRP-like cAMP-binding protein
MARPQGAIGNRLLAALTDAGGERWWWHLERVDLDLGQVLCEPGGPQRHAYFPTTAIVSLLYVLGSGASAEIAVVGNEGVVGTSLFLGGATTTNNASVLIAGEGFRIDAQTIRDEFDRSDSERHLLLLYTQALATQIAQTAACNRHHTIDQQVCGWLLHSLDRQTGREVVVTQELMASTLGVRRESVTAAVGHLQAAGLIHCARGHLSVLDPAGLERRACECHAVVKKEYDRLLPREAAARPAKADWRAPPASGDAAPIYREPRLEAAAACEA